MSEAATTQAATSVAADVHDTSEFGPSDADIIAAHRAKEASAAAVPPAGSQEAPGTQTATVATPDPSAAPGGAEAASDQLDARMRAYVDRQAQDTLERLEVKRAAQEAEARAKAAEERFQALQNRLREDPLTVTQEVAGYDFEALARRAATGSQPQSVEIARVKAEVAELKARAAADAQAAERARAEAQAAAELATWRAGVVPALEAKRDSYRHLLAVMEPGEVVNAVQSVVAQVYTNSGGTRVLGVEEAASLLEQQAKQRIERIRPLVTTATPSAQSTQQSQAPRSPVPGLTNAVTQSTQAPPGDPEDLSDAALNARARAWLAGNTSR